MISLSDFRVYTVSKDCIKNLCTGRRIYNVTISQVWHFVCIKARVWTLRHIRAEI